MPVLMDKTDWTKMFENAKRSGRVWRQHVNGNEGENLLALPVSGSFEVIFVEMPQTFQPYAEGASHPEGRIKPRISDFIGYGRRFHPEYRSTEDVMRELREGEDE
mgnify:CR=1 FL=1